MVENTAVAVVQNNNDLVHPFGCVSSFEVAQRMATALSSSSIVPDTFRGGNEGKANCLIALELASRLDCSVMQIMQSLYVIHGRPAFSAQFVIAALARCGRFSALRYEMSKDAEGKTSGCRAVATELATGERIEGPEITMEMARAEGWTTKAGSKWKTMPDIMLRYRAASAFGRLYAPDVMLGFYTQDEVETMPAPKRQGRAADLNAMVEAAPEPVEKPDEAAQEPAEIVEDVPIIESKGREAVAE